MKERYLKLNIYYQVSLWSLISLFLLLVMTSWLFFVGYLDIPLGIVLGGLIGTTSYFVLALIDKKELETHHSIGSIIVAIARVLALLAAMLLAAYLYYQLNIKILNIFAIMGGYLLPLIVLLILTLQKKRGTTNV
ncbi:MAG: hypothetical protein WCS49_01445 [Bacilli bacterium]